MRPYRWARPISPAGLRPLPTLARLSVRAHARALSPTRSDLNRQSRIRLPEASDTPSLGYFVKETPGFLGINSLSYFLAHGP
jgi:hypothetical protein